MKSVSIALYDDPRGIVVAFRNSRKPRELGPLYQTASRWLILLRCLGQAVGKIKKFNNRQKGMDNA